LNFIKRTSPFVCELIRTGIDSLKSAQLSHVFMIQVSIKKQLYILKMYEPSYSFEQMTNVEQLPRQGQVDWHPWRIIFPIISEGAKKKSVLTLYPLTLE